MSEVSKHSIHYKASYQDYDWLYQHFIIDGMTHEEMAKLIGCSSRVIKKWCVEKYRLTNELRLKTVQLTDKQRSIIIGGLLGDGHIDKREKYPVFIVTHAENQKDYLYWTYNELKNLCNHSPTFYQGKENHQIKNSVCDTQSFYRFETRSYKCIGELRKLNLHQIVDNLDELSFSIWVLDDGNYDRKAWRICAPFSIEDCKYILEQLKNKFNIQGIISIHNNYNYIRFLRSDSRIINDIILRNIPNDLDIIKYKITC